MLGLRLNLADIPLVLLSAAAFVLAGCSGGQRAAAEAQVRLRVGELEQGIQMRIRDHGRAARLSGLAREVDDSAKEFLEVARQFDRKLRQPRREAVAGEIDLDEVRYIARLQALHRHILAMISAMEALTPQEEWPALGRLEARALLARVSGWEEEG